MAELLSDEQISAGLASLDPAWLRDGDSIVREVAAKTFAAGIALVGEVAKVADEHNHHPDIDIRWTKVTFRLSSHSDGGLTHKDIALAAEIDRLSAER